MWVSHRLSVHFLVEDYVSSSGLSIRLCSAQHTHQMSLQTHFSFGSGGFLTDFLFLLFLFPSNTKERLFVLNRGIQ